MKLAQEDLRFDPSTPKGQYHIVKELTGDEQLATKTMVDMRLSEKSAEVASALSQG